MIERFNQIQAMLAEPFEFGSKPMADSKLDLPDSYAYCASSPHAADLLHKYSNTDKFWFTPRDQDIVATATGKILIFNRESQGNFQLGILLGSADTDPPVLYSDFHATRWTQYCEHFTDAIYTQIFDWQYRLVFDDQWGAEIDYSETIDVPFHGDTLAALRSEYTEHPQTDWFIETPDNATTWRFSTPSGERILLTHDPVPSNTTNRTNCFLEVLAPLENRVDRVKGLSTYLASRFV